VGVAANDTCPDFKLGVKIFASGHRSLRKKLSLKYDRVVARARIQKPVVTYDLGRSSWIAKLLFKYIYFTILIIDITITFPLTGQLLANNIKISSAIILAKQQTNLDTLLFCSNLLLL
jgi:hypothetical protein